MVQIKITHTPLPIGMPFLGSSTNDAVLFKLKNITDLHVHDLNSGNKITKHLKYVGIRNIINLFLL